MLILSGIVLLDIIPGMTQDLAWTIVNLSYLTVSRLPFNGNARARAELTSVSHSNLTHETGDLRRVPLR